MFKITPAKANTSNFKSVPRELLQKKIDLETSKLPPPGGYRPRHEFVEK